LQFVKIDKMKKAITNAALLAAAAISLAAVAGCKQKESNPSTPNPVAIESSIVFFNIDTVMKEYDMANDLRAVAENKAQSVTQELQRRQAKLEKDIKEFQEKVNKGLMTSSTAQVQQEKLQKAQASFEQYYGQKQQEIAEEQSVMMNQIADAIKTYVDNFNAEKGYSMILATSGDILPAPVVTADSTLDITRAIVEGLNKEYIKTKESK